MYGGYTGAAGADAVALAPEEAVMGDAVPPAPIEGGGEGSDPNLNLVSVELSMDGDYYHAYWGEPDPDPPKLKGPQVPYVGNKLPMRSSAGGRWRRTSGSWRSCTCTTSPPPSVRLPPSPRRRRRSRGSREC